MRKIIGTKIICKTRCNEKLFLANGMNIKTEINDDDDDEDELISRMKPPLLWTHNITVCNSPITCFVD